MTRPPIQRDLVGDWAIRQGATYAFGMRITSDGELLDTTGMEARMKVRAGDWDGAVQVDASTGNSRIIAGWTPRPAERNMPYIVDQHAIPDSGPNGYIYRCTTPGTSHASVEPTWPVVLGGTVSDGTATWECLTADDGSTDPRIRLLNLRLMLTATYTAGLTPWGRGVYDLELVNGTVVTRLYEGLAYLSPEATKG